MQIIWPGVSQVRHLRSFLLPLLFLGKGPFLTPKVLKRNKFFDFVDFECFDFSSGQAAAMSYFPTGQPSPGLQNVSYSSRLQFCKIFVRG